MQSCLFFQFLDNAETDFLRRGMLATDGMSTQTSEMRGMAVGNRESLVTE